MCEGRNEIVTNDLSSSKLRDCTLQGEVSEQVGLQQENCGTGQRGSKGSSGLRKEGRSHILRPSSPTPNSTLCQRWHGHLVHRTPR